MGSSYHAISARVLVGTLAFVATTSEAWGQDGFEAPIYLSVLPTPPTPSDDILLNFSIPNVGIEVGSTFAPEIEFDGNDILVTLNYAPPEIPPGGLQVPAAFFPDDTINLGMLARGSYTVTAVLPFLHVPVVAAGSTSFNIVPEPSAAALCALAAFLFAVPGMRLKRRRS